MAWSTYTATHKGHPNPLASEVNVDPHLRYLTFTTPSPNFIQNLWWISYSKLVIAYLSLILQYAFLFRTLCSGVSRVQCKKVFICTMESGIWIHPLKRHMSRYCVGIRVNPRL